MTLDHEITKDERLPHISAVRDVSLMKPVFQRAMFDKNAAHDQHRIRDCEILHIRYKRGRYVLILYRLFIEDAAQRLLGEQMVCGRMFHQGRSSTQYLKAQQQPLTPPAFGKPLFHVPEYEMVVWAFPNDRKLSGLEGFADDAQLQHSILPPVLEQACGPGWAIQDCTSEIIHYVPEHTCMVRLSVHIRHQESHEPRQLTVYGKTYPHDLGADTFHLMQQLWNSAGRRNHQILIPKPLWYDHALHILWQSSLDGSPLTHYSLGHPQTPFWLHQAGRAVATLHHIPVTGLKTLHTNDILVRLESAARHLSGIRPACGPALDNLIYHFTQQASTLGPQIPVTLHGDLHRKNLFLQGDKIGLIDLDSLCAGPACWDVGSFIAGLYYRVVISEISEERGRELTACFLAGYQSQAADRLSLQDLGWHVAMALITEQAYRCGTTFKSTRLAAIDELIDYARHFLSHGLNHSSNPQTAGSLATINTVST